MKLNDGTDGKVDVANPGFNRLKPPKKVNICQLNHLVVDWNF